MIIRQLSVFLENKSGRLAEVTQILGENGINISAFCIADTAEYGILRMIVSKPNEAYTKLKENGFAIHSTDVICLIVPHEPGGLSRALSILSQEKISIEYMYAFAVDNGAWVIIRTDSIQQTIDILQKHKMELKKANDIYQL
jgi:hypothetical protein